MASDGHPHSAPAPQHRALHHRADDSDGPHMQHTPPRRSVYDVALAAAQSRSERVDALSADISLCFPTRAALSLRPLHHSRRHVSQPRDHQFGRGHRTARQHAPRHDRRDGDIRAHTICCRHARALDRLRHIPLSSPPHAPRRSCSDHRRSGMHGRMLCR